MNLTVERDALLEALAFVCRRTRMRTNISILNHVLFDASKDALRLAGSDLDTCSEVTIAAETKSDGKWALPADQIVRLVKGLPGGGHVVVKVFGPQASVSCGKSQYKLPVLEADGFPVLLSVTGETTAELTQDDIRHLFDTPSAAADIEHPTYAYRGVMFSVKGGKAFGIGTDGVKALRTALASTADDAETIIVPPSSIEEIVRLSARGKTSLCWSKTLLSASVDGFKFTTKLIDGQPVQFDAWLKAKASTTSPYIEVAREDLESAISRLQIVATEHKTLVFEWDKEPDELRVTMIGAGEGLEKIECTAPGMKKGYFGVPIAQIVSLLGAVKSETVRLAPVSHDKPFRIIDTDDPEMIAVQQPCYAGHTVAARQQP